jgi:hypothetical protein
MVMLKECKTKESQNTLQQLQWKELEKRMMMKNMER